MAGLAVLTSVALACALGPLLSPYDPNAIDLDAIREAPSASHWLGTDSNGRDVLTRLLYGGRVSMAVGVSVAILATTLGLVMGILAGYIGGWVDGMVGRLTETVIAFPGIIAVAIFAAIFGPGLATVVVVLSLFSWPTAARVVRGSTLALREREFVLAAQTVGASSWKVILRHITPGVLSPLTVAATFSVANAILSEAALSYLGIGVSPPQATWGTILQGAQSLTILESAPWMWLPAGIATALTVVAINLIGDGLRDALDAKLE